MPNWKKVIVSGSNAILNSLNVTNGITGSLLGTSSYATQALTASNANTASYVNQLNQSVVVSGSLGVTGSVNLTAGSYNLLATGGQNLFFNNSGQLGSSATGTHITMNPAGNTTTFSQVVTSQNGFNATPGGNATTYALRTTVGAYPSAILASFTSGSVTVLSISGSGMVGTGSFNYLGSITATSFTGSLQGTASYATQALSASYALNASTASYFNGTSLTISQSLTINQNTASLASGTQTISTNSTGSYTSAFYKYTLASGSNARAGQVMAVWNGASIQYTDVTTNDIGTTLNVALTASLSGGNVLLTSTLPSSGWTVKTLVNLL